MISFNKSVVVLLSTYASGVVLSATAFSAVSPVEASPSVTAASLDTIWNEVPEGPPDAILGIAQAFRAAPEEHKVNVCVGAYRDTKGLPWVLPSVRKAEEMMLADDKENKEYLPIDGDQAYVEKALKFAYGASAPLERIAGVQTLSGTGACRIGGQFLADFYPNKNIYVPDPTWGNHHKIFAACGLNVNTYRYYDRSTNRLDLEGMLKDFEDAPEGSILLLHACAHNPTGCDPTDEQWSQLLDVIKAKGHLIFFDSAYQGFASGDAEADAKALRRVVDAGFPVLLAQSFAKNFGLYGERCGTLSVVAKDAAQKDILMSQLKCIIRPMYSSPPKHGSSIVRTVLSDEKLTEQYYQECAGMAERIQSMRSRLVETLKEVGSTHDWSHVSEQIGMFAYTGMNSEMCDELTDKYAIYLTRDGRISIAGLNDKNLEYVATAVHAVTDGKSITQ
eukprot:CAMPEP_0172367368 /NCGR_PEP_ID=MMETSP1060-20121228/20952_1 /TAXON_ID=37318 /ORGANISM="Pseudo-nitzschia pungens, Strain cf. cingulata" /LENGTH=447 /DNA_ID=CAMNT_0013091591 /DNA_START=67 /DNA_END=1410 /DNA_ORIENTATION=-